MIVAALAMLLAQPLAIAPIIAPAPQSAAELLLPAGTAVKLKTVDPLDSRTTTQGQRFQLLVDEDVTVGSGVVIPKGMTAVGEVEAVSGKGMVGKSGRLVLSPLFIELAGKRVNLTGASDQQGSDATAGVAVASILVSGLALFVTGKSASLPAGSSMLGRVRTDVSLPAASTERSKPPATP